VKWVSLREFAKQACPRNSTDTGKQTEWREEHPENADSSIRSRFEPDSKDKFETAMQLEKQPLERIFTEAGRQID
jgi:hypothetical protein